MPENQLPLPNGAADKPFSKIVEESKLKIAAETPQPPSPGKRPVGRPRKTMVSETPAPAVQSSMHQPSSVNGPAPTPDISNHLILPLMGVSRIPAGYFKCPDLALTPDEAALCAHSCNELLNVFVPDIGQMSPKTAAIIGACSVFGSIGFNKYQIYLKSKIKSVPPPEIKVESTAAPTSANVFPVESAPVGPKMSAIDYFKKTAQ